MSGGGILPLGHPMAKDTLDYSREIIVECAQRAAMYAHMLMDLASARDDVGANYMRSRLATEIQGINAAFQPIAEARDPARRAAAFFDSQQQQAVE